MEELTINENNKGLGVRSLSIAAESLVRQEPECPPIESDTICQGKHFSGAFAEPAKLCWAMTENWNVGAGVYRESLQKRERGHFVVPSILGIFIDFVLL